MSNFMISLIIMAKGMLSIFIVLGLLAVIILILGKIFN